MISSTGPRRVLPALVLAGAVLLVFAPHLGNGFVYDDHPQIEKNPAFDPGGSWLDPFARHVWEGLGREETRQKYYRPVFVLASRLVFELGNGSPVAFHAASLILHLLCVGLVWAALDRLGMPRNLSFASAAVYAIHPLAGQVVYWAGCLGELLLQAGTLGAFLCVAAARSAGGPKRAFLLAGGALCTLLAMLSKETGIVIAPILTVHAFFSVEENARERATRLAPVWVATFLYLAARAAVLGSLALPSLHPSPGSSLREAALALLWFARYLALPFPLSPLHGLPEDSGAVLLTTAFSMIAFLLFAVVLVVRHRPAYLFWLAWTLLPLIPPLLQPFLARRTGILVSERYLLLSLVPWVSMLVRGADSLLGRMQQVSLRRGIAIGLLLAAALAGGFLTYDYGKVYADDETLFSFALSREPDNPLALHWLATLRMDEGRHDLALPLLERAVIFEPRRAEAHLNLGIALLRSGRTAEGVSALRRALRINGRIPGANLILADGLRDLGEIQEAARHYEAELDVDPANVAARVNLGTCFYIEGRTALAVRHWEEALSRSPANSDLLFNLGMAYRALGDPGRSKEHLERFLAVAGDRYAPQRKQARIWLTE